MQTHDTGQCWPSPLPTSRQTPAGASSGEFHGFWHSLAGQHWPCLPQVAMPGGAPGHGWPLVQCSLKPEVNHLWDIPSPASDTSLNQTVTGMGAEGRGDGTALTAGACSRSCNLESHAAV